MFDVKVLADSISLVGIRIITLLITYPRIVHSEWMTHRMLARNSASTRAIMLIVQLRNILSHPFIPEEFGTNQRGMQPAKPLTGDKHKEAVEIWLNGCARDLTTMIELILGKAKASALLGYSPNFGYASLDVIREHLDEIADLIPKTGPDGDKLDLAETTILNVHKQLAGRFVETNMWHSVIVTATELDNFFGLRDHPDAQGEIAKSARMVRKAYDESSPVLLEEGEWHTPLVEKDEFDDVETAIKVSAARCAAVSYNRQYAEVKLKDLLERYDTLVKGGHMSPLEHQARPFSDNEWTVRNAAKEAVRAQVEGTKIGDQAFEQIIASLDFNGNFRGWHSHRKDIPNESDFSRIQAEREGELAELARQDAEANSSSVA